MSDPFAYLTCHRRRGGLWPGRNLEQTFDIPHISPHWHLLCVPFWMGPGPGRNERGDGRSYVVIRSRSRSPHVGVITGDARQGD